ncbi:Elongator subunit elp4 [Coelomomyces lativittatus]|nr:Elongator subunit elp4 [Coelomomyces lativittatus]
MSTGVEALDALLGGGWPLGTLMVMQEDRFTGYAQLLLQTYVSQGLVHGHDVLVVSADELPPSLLSQCPGYEDIEPLSPPPPPPSSSMVACHSEHDETDSFMISQKSEKENSLLNADIVPVTKNEKKNGGRDRLLKKKNVEDEEEDEEEEEDVEDEEEKEDKLTIAWRYQHLPKLNQRNDFSSHPSTKKVSFQLPPSSTSSATHAPFCSKFLLTEKLTPTQIENAKDRLFYLDLTRSEDPFEDLYVYLSQLLAKKEYIRKKQPSLGGGIQHVLRIAIFSFCSPFWKRTKHFTYPELRCFHRLKALLFNTSATLFLTLSSTCTLPIAPIRQLSDFQFALESFSTSPKWSKFLRNHSSTQSTTIGDYSGLFLIHKRSAFHALTFSSSTTTTTSTNPTSSTTSNSSSSLLTTSSLNNGSVSQDLAFVVRRKRFVIEPWHLPPDLGPTPSPQVGGGCFSNTPLPKQSQKHSCVDFGTGIGF